MVIDCRDSLELGSLIERKREDLSRFTLYEVSLMDEDHLYRDQSSTTKTVGSSNSQGATTVSERLCLRGPWIDALLPVIGSVAKIRFRFGGSYYVQAVIGSLMGLVCSECI